MPGSAEIRATIVAKPGIKGTALGFYRHILPDTKTLSLPACNGFRFLVA